MMKRVSTTWDGRRVSSEVRLGNCTHVWGWAKFEERGSHGWGKIVLHNCSDLSRLVRISGSQTLFCRESGWLAPGWTWAMPAVVSIAGIWTLMTLNLLYLSHLSIYLSINQPICLHMDLSIYLSFYPSNYLSFYPSIYLYICVFNLSKM